MAKEKLLSIFGAKLSKDGAKLVITLVGGEGEEKTFYNACVKLNNQQKTHAKIEEDGNYALLKVPMLVDREEVDEDEVLPF